MSKKWIFFIGMMLFMVQAIHSQEIAKSEVPTAILKQFSKDFKKSDKDQWTKSGTNYIVVFEDANKTENSVWYTPEAKIMIHRINVPIKDLPKEITNKDYGIPIVKASMEVLKNEKIYELVLEGGEYIYESIKK